MIIPNVIKALDFAESATGVSDATRKVSAMV
jgi:hypothetical protein